jgi:outer membrane protein OmpA-like peptidoglycan-associated protein
MKKILGLLTFVAFLATAMSAKADPVPGWYIGAGAGANFPTDTNPSVNGTDNKVSFDTGWEILGDLGYSFYNGLRVEGELSEARANADKVRGLNATNGRINNLDAMGNVLYDFKTGTRWTPYLGAGVGVGSVDADHIGTLSNAGSINDSSVELAYQGIAGVAYEVADHWAITTDYRYIRTTDPTLKTTAGGTVSPENASHNVIIGVRYTMYAPEKPAPQPETMTEAPAPAAAPVEPVAAPAPQSYMVFFDFDKSTLTPEAISILTAAAEDYKKGGYVRIVVTGHTDTVGTVPYNQKLSERRADAVKLELVKLGVDSAQITAIGVGKDGLLVPTADQVREAKNRRAEIVFNKE